jgi:hypothetical protein
MSKREFHSYFDEERQDRCEYIIPELHRRTLQVLAKTSERLTKSLRPLLDINQEDMYIRNHRGMLKNTDMVGMLHEEMGLGEMEKK